MALWKKMEIFPTPSCKIQKNVLASTKRYIFVGRVGGGAYNMENKDINTKWEIVEITIGTIFFFFLDSYSLFFMQGVSKSHMKKNNPHLKCQSPPKIPIWTKSLLYKPSEKWLNPPTPQNSTKLINLLPTAVYQVTYLLSNKLKIILPSIPLPIVSFCSIF